MSASDDLYELLPEAPEVPAGLPLVVALTGFSDAGGAIAQFAEHLLDSLDGERVLRFVNDDLLDYRARRPVLVFEEDHFTEYRPARLELHLLHDELERPFLFLTGYEPDFRWESFVDTLVSLVDRFGVEQTVWAHAIPMPVPHTRSINWTVSGTRADLIESYSVWRPSTHVPGNVLHLFELRLQESGHQVTGFALLVPHYLGDTEYPAAAISATEAISVATGLILPTDDLREQDRDFLLKLQEHVTGNPELARLVSTLEERHDDYMESTSLRSPLTGDDGRLASGDDIAAELEKFLANRRDDAG